MKVVKRLIAALVAALLSGLVLAQEEEPLSPLLALLAPIPLSTQFVIPNAAGERVDLHVNAAVFPVPYILARELNVDLGLNLAYRLGGEPLVLYLGAGPRFSLVNSAWLPGAEAVGSYLGGGAAAGLALGFDFLGVVLEANGDVLFGLTEGSTPMRLVPRLKVGLNLPVVGAMSLL
jgi:hypothetical protein